MSKNTKFLSISIESEYKDKLDIIGKKEFRKKSGLMRKWIDENWKEEYEQELIKIRRDEENNDT